MTASPSLPLLLRVRRAPGALRGRWTLVLTAGGLVLVAALALLAPVLAPYPPLATDLARTLRPPSSAHWFGTDELGRDVLSRVLYGARTGPVVAVTVVGVSLLVGTATGLAAGYCGGWTDEALMRLTDVFLAVPALLLALALTTVLAPGPAGLTVALVVTWWPWYARLVRGEAASVTGRAYIEACRTLGLGHRRILLRHVLPNASTPLLVQASTDVGGVLLVASGLSFLGLGPQPPAPDWGLMVEESQNYFTTHWWLGTFPGLAIMVVAALCFLLGDALRDRLDPRHTPRI